MNWDDLRVILAIGREGTLSGAARVLGTSHSTVFRQINAIEARFDTRFFNRLASGYALTESGEAALRTAAVIEEDILELARELQGKDLRLQGRIRLTVPEGVAHYLLSPHIASFYRLHPDIQIDLLISSHTMQLDRHEVDLALRVTSQPPPASIGKKVADFTIAVYAAPTYLDGVKDVALTDYHYVLTKDGLDWLPPSIWKNKARPKVICTADNILAVANAAKEGMGATILPCFIGDSEPRLQRLTAPLNDMKLELWILTHADLRQTARVKALMTHLYEGLSAERSRIEGKG